MRWIVIVALAGCTYTPPSDAPADAAATSAFLFLADYQPGQFYRYTIGKDDPMPAPQVQFALTGALSPLIEPTTGELWISNLDGARLDRFTDPFGSPTPNGSVIENGLLPSVAKMLPFRDEVWVMVPDMNGAGGVLRWHVDATGVVTTAGPSLFERNGRGLAFDATQHHAYVSECCIQPQLLHFTIDDDGVAALQTTITENITAPHGLVVTPWHELLVANLGASTIARWSLDEAGTPTFISDTTGNGLSTPVDLALTPWNELYVTNIGGTISRFTFDDDTHALLARDSFPVPTPGQLAWTAIVPR